MYLQLFKIGLAKKIVDISFDNLLNLKESWNNLMDELYTRQSLPGKKYRELLGTAICVFNSNNSFIIENILRYDDNAIYNWHNLIDRTSGNLATPIKKTITKNSNTKIAEIFDILIDKRNRIIHSFQITDDRGIQILATKKRTGEQYIITEEILIEFIQENSHLSKLLHDFRGY